MKLRGIEIDAVTFDVDGTLYNGGRALVRILPVLWRHRKLMGEYRRVREGLRGCPDPVDLRARSAGAVAEKLGLDPFETRVTIEEILYGNWIGAMDRSLLRPGVVDFIAKLKRAGVKLGLISDYPVDEKLLKLGLTFVPWCAVVDCEMVGALKPSPLAFLKASEQLGVEPCRILHIGDREDCDVKGARAAGFRSALLLKGPGSFRRRKTSEADITFGDYRKLAKEIQ